MPLFSDASEIPYPVADGHCDYLYGVVNERYAFDKPVGRQNLTLERLREGHVALQFFAAWIDMAQKMPPLQQCLSMIDAYHSMHKCYKNELIPLHADFVPGDRIATVLTIEGGEAIEGSLAVLRMFYRLGVRAMALTWNFNNELAGAAMQSQKKGLTSLGKDVVKEMCELGMAVDISHLSDASIDDVLKVADRPPFASHSNARVAFESPRSLTDEHIAEIARRGGVVGINFYDKQLTANERACIRDMVAQSGHVVRVGGIDSCAIGSDFDGMNRYPLDLQHSGDFPKLCYALEQSGFSQEDIRKIMYENLFRYISQFV